MTKSTRKRRTAEQMIASHEAEIARIKRRAVAQKARAAPEGTPFIVAVRVVDKAMKAASKAGNDEMFRALESARATLGEQLIRMGVRAPETCRKRDSKGEAA